MAHALRLALLAGILGATNFAAAFDPHEHKKAGDEGSALAFQEAPVAAKLPWKTAGGQALVRVYQAGDPVFASQGPGGVIRPFPDS